MTKGTRISLEEIRAFLYASEAVEFEAKSRTERYTVDRGGAARPGVRKTGKTAKGLVRSDIEKMTGMSRSQTTRLIKTHQEGKEIKPQQYRRRRFAQHYAPADIALLVDVDTAHETLSGPRPRRRSCSASSTTTETPVTSAWRGCR